MGGLLSEPDSSAEWRAGGDWEASLGQNSFACRLLLSPISPTVKTLRSSSGSSPIWNPAFCLLKVLTCCCSVAKLCPMLSCDPMDCPVLKISCVLLKLISTELMMP